ncbi:MAG: DUF420 domain-containing protein [Bacteroidia bacterium]
MRTSKFLLSSKAIWFLAISIPIVVALLLQLPRVDLGINTGWIPHANATINTTVSLLLVGAYLAIRKKNRELHKKLMLSAFGLSVLFLVLYVLYHLTMEEMRYTGTGWLRALYLFILITHIGLSGVIIPLALLTLRWAWEGSYAVHKRWARWTFPLWLYVAVTGVLVYLFLHIL